MKSQAITTHSHSTCACLLLLLLTASTPTIHVTASNTLDAVILQDMIPTDDSNPACQSNFNDFYIAYDTSHWDEHHANAEQELLLAELKHVDENLNRTWEIRVGTGGNLYSLKAEFGEAMAPQHVKDALWVDEVHQMVAVNSDLNLRSEGKSWYVHQAGTYQHDDGITMHKPFFSPNVAKHCSRRGDQQCAFASWGQQAHIPTNYTSSVIYLTRYRDCGKGVIETTNLIHNAADPSLLESPSINWENVPWTSFRTETFEKMLFTDLVNEDAMVKFPMTMFGQEPVIRAKDTKGYMIMSQNLPNPPRKPMYEYSLPCSMNGYMMDCSHVKEEASEAVRLVVREDDAAMGSLSHIRKHGKYVVKLPIRDTVTIRNGIDDCDLFFVNERTEEKIKVKAVMHWAWKGNEIYFHPPDHTAEEINRIFAKDDVIRTYHTTMKRFPCTRDGFRWKDCPETDFEDEILQFVIAEDDPCRFSQGWTDRQGGKYTAWITLEPTHDIRAPCRDCKLRFVNSRNFEHFTVTDIVVWAFKGEKFYFSTETDCEDINTKLWKGDTLLIDYFDGGKGKSKEENLAMSLVYGTDDEMDDRANRDWLMRPAGIRYGTTAREKSVVFTYLARAKIDPGETYVNRQYMIIDRYDGMDERAKFWNKHAFQDFYEPGELQSRKIRLHQINSSTFGAAMKDTCPNAQKVCEGRSTPQVGKLALYAIRCGQFAYAGPDPYAFSPLGEAVRSYECIGQPEVRPTWKLLGFFDPEECESLQWMKYDATFQC